jgi:hypothetical protein
MARLLDVHPKTLLKYANAGRVPTDFATPMGTRWRWHADFAARPIFLGVPMAAVSQPPPGHVVAPPAAVSGRPQSVAPRRAIRP